MCADSGRCRGTIRHIPQTSEQHRRAPSGALDSPFGAPEFGDATLASVSEALTPDDFHVESGHNGLADPRLTQELYAAIGVNPRFACVRVDASDEHFSEEQQMQFAAVTMLLPGGTLAVAFRGTDARSWVGKRISTWRFATRCPHSMRRVSMCAPWRAVARPDGAAGAFQGRQSGRVCGDERARAGAAACHGGVFAGRAGVPVADRRSDPYRSVMPLIVKIVPDSSIVGMILETPEPMRVVRSDQKGVMQHLTVLLGRSRAMISNICRRCRRVPSCSTGR